MTDNDSQEDEAVEEETFLFTRTQCEAAFTEWDRRYRDDPAGFESDMERLTRGQTVELYGEEVTPYFFELLNAVTGTTAFALPA